MKIVGHTDYQTTANIYTHVRDEMLRKATVNLDEVFGRRGEGKSERSSKHMAGQMNWTSVCESWTKG